jgi:hypothetical protein
VTEPTREPIRSDDTDDERSDEDRDISDVGLPHLDGAARGDAEAPVDEAALDEVFPPEHR